MALLLIRPSMPLRERFRKVRKWDVAAPMVLCATAVLTDPDNLAFYIRSYIYGSVFMIGLGTGFSILFFREQGQVQT
jgi:hypothetical protein